MDRPDGNAPTATVNVATRAAITDILALYCRAIDRRRWSLMEQCFHHDATYAFGAVDGSWRNSAVVARGLIDPLPMTHHQLGQTFLVPEGPNMRAETYFTATHCVPADASPGVFGGRGYEYHAVVGGRYLDDFTQRADDWRIARRSVILDWQHDLSPIAEQLRTEND